jgi:hypothetical protein
MPGFLKGVMTPTVPTFSGQPWMDINNFGPRGPLDFTSDVADFNDADFGFLDHLCSEPFSSEQQQQQPTFVQVHTPEVFSLKDARKHVAIGAEAFKRSTIGIWLPTRTVPMWSSRICLRSVPKLDHQIPGSTWSVAISGRTCTVPRETSF